MVEGRETASDRRAKANEREVVEWIEASAGVSKGDQRMDDWLRSGVVLCTLINSLRPGLVKTINQQELPFKQMENIKNFLSGARALGVPESSMFGTNDLYEGKNIDSVIKCIYALGGAAQTACPDFKGPKLGIAVHKGKDNKPEAETPAHLLTLTPSEVVSKVTGLKEEVETLREANARLQKENTALRDRCEVDIPHWTSMLCELSQQLEGFSQPLASVPLGEKLLTVVSGMRTAEAGLRGMRGAPIREELEELKKAFAMHLTEAQEREANLQQEVVELRATLHTSDRQESSGQMQEAKEAAEADFGSVGSSGMTPEQIAETRALIDAVKTEDSTSSQEESVQKLDGSIATPDPSPEAHDQNPIEPNDEGQQENEQRGEDGLEVEGHDTPS